MGYFTLNTTLTTLEPEDLLMILSPKRDLTKEELQTILDFANRGGSMLLTCDCDVSISDKPNYMALLRSYGFEPKVGMAVASEEEPGTYYTGNRTYLVPVMQPTETTQDLVESRNTFLILPGSRAFALAQDGDRNLLVNNVLTTGAKTYLRDFSDGSTSLGRRADDPTGPFALALQARRITETGSVSRAFVLGSSSMLINEDIYSMTVAQEFILRTVQSLLGQPKIDLGIMAKVGLRPRLSTASVRLGSIILVCLPLSIAAAAVIVLGLRRKR